LSADRQAAQQEIDAATDRILDAEGSILQIDTTLAQMFAEKENLGKQTAALRGRRVHLSEQLQQIQQQVQELRSQHTQVQQCCQELAVQVNEFTVRQETLIQRVQEELQMDLEAAYQQYHADQQEDFEQLEQRINDLRGKIDRLGNVNLDAINELAELEERLKFLSEQRDDLNEAKRRLEGLIGRLDQQCRQRFLETFSSVRENFHELFRKLFGGGKADLVLEDPDNVLETGIEILARPPGKELQRISLLSGGEKTLTTVALLFSIFKSRPSPFCILDEVDAALDEANIDRFNVLLGEFLEHSQFVVITHSKRTMSYAGALYGITMQEAGISKQVGVRFDDHADTGGSDDEEETEAA